MKGLLSSLLLCFTVSNLSCKDREYNSDAAVKDTGDMVTATKDPATGLYSVRCQDGTTWTKIEVSQLKSGDVCKKNPAVKQLNAMAYDALLMWRQGGIGLNGDKGVFEIPSDYSVETGKKAADGVFYVSGGGKEFWEKVNEESRKFVGKPTEGAVVKGDVLSDQKKGGILIYPPRDGYQLKLKFSESFEGARDSKNFELCKKMGLRLPTIVELFDFCVAGTTFFQVQAGAYLENRCSNGSTLDERWVASVSVDPDNLEKATQLHAFYGVVDSYQTRGFSDIVRCVGAE